MRDLDLLVLEYAVDLDLGAERCLDDGHVGAAMQVVAVALEELMGLNAAGDDEVAGSRRRCKPASPKPVRRSCWESRMPTGTSTVTRWRSGTRPCPLHSGQGLSMVVPGAVAFAASGCRLHVAQERMLNGDHAALAAALWTGDLLAAFGHARAIAIGARGQAVVDDLLLGARGHFLQGSGAGRRPYRGHRCAADGDRPLPAPPKKLLKISPKPPPNKSSKST